MENDIPKPEDERYLEEWFNRMRERSEDGKKLRTLVPLLPMLLNLNGKPYSLSEHFQFEPAFSVFQPEESIWLTGRQVSKSTTIAADGVVRCSALPHYKILYITPLFEQVRRLSSNYVRPFIEQSPIRQLWASTKAAGSVLQRDFSNGSRMLFSFAMLSAERVRSASCDEVRADEVQGLDGNHFPVIQEVMAASKWKIWRYTGTPLTTAAQTAKLWRRSSQAEWVMPCQHCPHWNIPSLEYDMLKMLGPYRDDISVTAPGLICAKCGKPLAPQLGRWLHRRPARQFSFPGYHIPQPIMQMHYASSRSWAKLLVKQNSYSQNRFTNEVLGETSGEGGQLISEAELRAACTLPWQNNPKDLTEAIKQRQKYQEVILCADWGGGGVSRMAGRMVASDAENVSLTALAIVGWHPNGQVHVIWGKKLLTPYDFINEGLECAEIYKKFRCTGVAHDFTGAGAGRESVMVSKGVPRGGVLGFSLGWNKGGSLMSLKPPTVFRPISYYQLDKPASLLRTIAGIKLGLVRFFQYDYKREDEPGLIRDFTGLVDVKQERHSGSDVYTIQRHPHQPDDFAQAINLGCCALWYLHQRWPSMANAGTALNEMLSRIREQHKMRSELEPDHWGEGDSGGV